MGNYNSNKKISGFSLVEMAVVLVIAGLILGTVISAMNTQVTGQRLKSNIERQSVIKQALVNYVARNFHLPCPADPTDATSTGQSQRQVVGTVVTCNGVTVVGTTPDAYIGAIPWVDLGLTKETVTDAYGRRFTYAVSYSAVGLNSTTISGMTGNMVLYETADPALANPINACLTTNPCEKLAVAVVISHGANGYGAYYDGSTSQINPTGGSPDEDANANNNDLFFVLRDYSQTNYDDAVLWLKPDDLLTPLVASGVIKHSAGFTVGEIEKAKIDLIRTYYEPIACPPSPGTPLTPGYVVPATATPTTELSFNDAWGQPLLVTAESTEQTYCASATPAATIAFTIKFRGMDTTVGTADDYDTEVKFSELLTIAAKLGLPN